MRAVVGLEGRHDIAIDRLPVNFGMEVREGFAQRVVKATRSFLVWRPAWLRCVVQKVVAG